MKMWCSELDDRRLNRVQLDIAVHAGRPVANPIPVSSNSNRDQSTLLLSTQHLH